MKPETEFKREMNRNYMVLRPEQSEKGRYALRMMTGNQIPGLLEFREKQLDGEVWYYYDITSKQPLSRILGARKLNGMEVRAFIAGIVSTLGQIERFFLDEDQLCLEPEYIYVNPENLQSWLCLVPGRHEDFASEFRRLARCLLDHVDHNDSDAVVAAFGVFKESEKENFGIEDVERCIRNSGKTVEPRERESELTGSTAEKNGNQEWAEEGSGGREVGAWEGKERTGKNAAKTYRIEDNHSGERTWKRALFFLPVAFGIPAAVFLLLGISGLIRYKWFLIAVEILLAATAAIAVEGGKKTGKKDADPETEKEEEWEIQYREVEMESRNFYRPEKANTEGIVFPETEEEEEMQTMLLTSLTKERSGRRLVAEDGSGEIPVPYFPFLIGKSRDMTDFCLNIPEVSRLHVRLDQAESGYTATDLNSTNGTKVDGRLLGANETADLELGGVLEIAAKKYRFL